MLLLILTLLFACCFVGIFSDQLRKLDDEQHTGPEHQLQQQKVLKNDPVYKKYLAVAPQLTQNDRAASLLGGVGVTTVGGTDVYTPSIAFPSNTPIAGPFEAGFDSQIDTLLGWLGCSPSSNGYIDGGIDTQTSVEMVALQCGVTLPRVSGNDYIGLMWSCGAHSPPNQAKCTSPPGSLSGYSACVNPAYHFHQNFSCLYSLSATGHSTKVGVTTASAVTVRPIYGKYESTNTLPTDLDACSGHFGTTPDSPTTAIYHHHVQDKPPFAVGCYGPNANGGLVTLAECRSYYSTCGDSDVATIATTKGSFQYDKWCPCFDSTTGSNVLTTNGAPSAIPSPAITVAPSNSRAPSFSNAPVASSPSSSSSAASCFAASETVTLESGSQLPINQVKLGQRILSANTHRELVFAEVIAIPHGNNNWESSFLKLTISSGHDIALTEDHLLIGGVCG